MTKEELDLYATLIKEKALSHMEEKMRREHMIQDAIKLTLNKEGMRCKNGPRNKGGPRRKEKGLHL